MNRISPDRLFNMEIGIGEVVRADPRTPSLPEGTAPPAGARSVQQMDLLFSTPTIDQTVMAAFAPVITDTRILEAATYVATLDSAHAVLTDLAANAEASDRAVFVDALIVLNRERDDRLIFDAARRALMRG